MYNKRGISVMELAITMVIVGVLASVVVGKSQEASEKAIAGEGKQALYHLLTAQKARKILDGSYTNNLSLLDIQISQLKYFDTPSAGTSPATLAWIDRSDGSYRLSVGETGIIACAAPASQCMYAGQEPNGREILYSFFGLTQDPAQGDEEAEFSCEMSYYEGEGDCAGILD